MDKSMSIGWFGIPGASSRFSTLTHVVSGGKPICGAKLGPKQEFQWCAYGTKAIECECRRCKKAIERTPINV